MPTLPHNTLQSLKSRAHHLKPVIIIGDKGLTDALHTELDRALEHHELIKIKVNAETREERQAMIQTILDAHNAHLVQQVGHTVTIYREKQDA